ncbi:MAG: hypothetical protein JWM10_86 [Myxococcaceae bacterium]|nr:hypothetical protein [Myxococcaceae bacterium]
MKQTILVPVSAGASQEYLIDEAIAEAAWRRSSLLMLRVIDLPMEFPAEAYLMTSSHVGDALEESARAELQALRRRVPHDFEASVRVEYGVPWRVICDVAKSEDVALVMVGAHEHRLFDGLLGTTASRVVDHLDRSVLVVRDGAPSA